MDIDIKENDILRQSPELLDLLLKDHTTQEHIFWATDDYKDLGDGYQYGDCIAIDKITGDKGLIVQPRVLKSKEAQAQRIKDKAEVFTPTWISSSIPSGEEMPMACLVSVVDEISPSNGANTTPSTGSMPTPSPRTPAAKVSSGI